MKVFVSKFNGGYGGGLCLVAANTPDEALATAAKSDTDSWYFQDYDCDLGAYILKYTNMTPFEEIPYLTACLDEPKVIAFSVYEE